MFETENEATNNLYRLLYYMIPFQGTAHQSIVHDAAQNQNMHYASRTKTTTTTIQK